MSYLVADSTKISRSFYKNFKIIVKKFQEVLKKFQEVLKKFVDYS